MLSTKLKRAALALLLAAAGSATADAQVESKIEFFVDGNVGTVQATEVPPAQAPPSVFAAPPVTVKSAALGWVNEQPSPFWIGVEGQPLDDAMRSALELTEKHGILVARVTEESPAAKAGLQAGDILLQWCDADKKCEPIQSVEHLVKLVQDAATKKPDQAVTLEFRRRGKAETVELKPAKRAEAGPNFIFKSENIGPNEHARHQQSALQQQLKMLESQRDEAKKKLEAAGAKTSRSGPVNKEDVANFTKAEIQYKLLEAQVKQAEAQLKQFEVWTKAMSDHGFAIANPGVANFDVLIPAPGFVTRGSTGSVHAQAQIHGHAQMKPIEWPEELSVTMTRKGNKPAEFVVQRGEEKWEVTSETLKDLPADVRALIEPLAEPQKSRMMRLWSSQGNDVPGRVELRVPEGERPLPAPGLPIAPPRVVIHATPSQLATPPAPAATQKQIDDLQKALELLRKQVEQMEKK